MLTRTAVNLGLLLLAGATLLACGGPSKYGQQMREEARGRVNLMNAQVNFEQAKQAFHGAQFDKAEREINLAIIKFPDRVEYHVLKGRIFLESARLEDALRTFEQAMAVDDTAAEPHYFTGIVYQRWTKYDQARVSYEKAFELDATSVHYLMAAAESMIAADDAASAKAVIETNLTYFEHNAGLRQLLAQIEGMIGDPHRAVALFEEARMLNPEDAHLLEELARAHFSAGSYGKCVDAIKHLNIMFEVDRPDLRLLEARSLVFLDRPVQARELYMKLSREMPADAGVWIELGSVAWEVEDFRRVAQAGARLTSLAPQRYEGYMFKGINERHKGQLGKAESLLRTAAEFSEHDAMPLVLLGEVREEMGNLAGARQAYQTALHQQPSPAEAAQLQTRLEQLGMPDRIGAATPSAIRN